MKHEERLEKIGLPEYIKKTHEAITEKFPIDKSEFDAWYTNRDYVYKSLDEYGQIIAKRLSEDFGIVWKKEFEDEKIHDLLKAEGISTENWQDGPDGTLAGITIILAGWLANQAAKKTQNQPQDGASSLFENCIRPLIISSMDIGIKLAENK